ncbi:unnamed protein product [Ixodes persulcatus]
MQRFLHTQLSKSESHYCVNTCKDRTHKKKCLPCAPLHLIVQACAKSPPMWHAVSIKAFSFLLKARSAKTSNYSSPFFCLSNLHL